MSELLRVPIRRVTVREIEGLLVGAGLAAAFASGPFLRVAMKNASSTAMPS